MQKYYNASLFEDAKFNPEQLCDGVFIYKNALQKSQQVLDLIKILEHEDEKSLLTSGWGPWGPYGKTTYFYNDLKEGYIENIFNSVFHDSQLNNLNNYGLCRRTLFEIMINSILTELNQKIIHDFLIKNNFKVPNNSFFARIDLCKYDFQQKTPLHEMEMPFHNDYVTADHHLSCDKFLVSCNTYFTSDYSGAEIVFYINGKLVEYKPKAGDVLVFPSGNPNYVSNNYCLHAVKRGSGNRYISRYFLKYCDDRDNLTKVQDLINNKDESVSKKYWEKRSYFGSVSLEEINKHMRGEISKFEFEKYYEGEIF